METIKMLESQSDPTGSKYNFSLMISVFVYWMGELHTLVLYVSKGDTV